MTNTRITKEILVQTALKLVPPLIRSSLLSEKTFREKYGFRPEAKIFFENNSIAFKWSILYKAVSSVLSENCITEISDTGGRVWTLQNESSENEVPNLILASTNQRLDLSDFNVLSKKSSTRIRTLEKLTSEVNLPSYACEKWRRILIERALEYEEFIAFHNDLLETPVNFEQLIQDDIITGKSSASTLVPNSLRYFERLVGVYDGSSSIREYAARTGRNLFLQLAEWRPIDGFLLGLLLSSHSDLTAQIPIDKLSKEKLAQAYDFIEKHGDTLSRLGALEVGLRILPAHPEVEPFLMPLVIRIRDDDVEKIAGEINLLSALFVLVDGELSRLRLMTDKPPFYRRLASLAQAALIHRQVTRFNVDKDELIKWAIISRGEQFYMQSLADMRIEPRWIPEFFEAHQMKADFVGRIVLAGREYEKNMTSETLQNIILGDDPHSLSKLFDFPRLFYPGPLEGTENNPNTLPDDLARVIKENLNTEKVNASSFIAIINLAIIYDITLEHAELAATALRRGKYTLSNLEDKSQLMGIMNGLATVAAVTRNPTLADELRILVRRYYRDPQYGFSIVEALRICLITSAAHKDLMEWRNFAGEWLTELAFEKLKKDEVKLFHSHLLKLLHTVPELWVSCSRADAALLALHNLK